MPPPLSPQPLRRPHTPHDGNIANGWQQHGTIIMIIIMIFVGRARRGFKSEGRAEPPGQDRDRRGRGNAGPRPRPGVAATLTLATMIPTSYFNAGLECQRRARRLG